MGAIFDLNRGSAAVTDRVTGTSLAWPEPPALDRPVTLAILGDRACSVLLAAAQPVVLGVPERLATTLTVSHAFDRDVPVEEPMRA